MLRSPRPPCWQACRSASDPCPHVTAATSLATPGPCWLAPCWDPRQDQCEAGGSPDGWGRWPREPAHISAASGRNRGAASLRVLSSRIPRPRLPSLRLPVINVFLPEILVALALLTEPCPVHGGCPGRRSPPSPRWTPARSAVPRAACISGRRRRWKLREEGPPSRRAGPPLPGKRPAPRTRAH